MKKLLLTLLFGLTAIYGVQSQVGIGTKTPAASSILDLTATNKGFLMPRVALTGTLDVTTIAAPASSLLVYNTATAGTSPNDVTPGFYHWTGTKWASIGSNDGFIIKRVACAGTKTQVITESNTQLTGAMFVSYEDPSGDIIATSIKSRTAGVSFEVEFAAEPPVTAFINYAYNGNIATIAVGPQGPAGADGAAGAAGATGAVGPQGSAGAVGLAGSIGPIGPTGSPGAQGANGQDGAAATIAVGTVTALVPGATPTVTNAGTSAAAVLNFGIPTTQTVVKGTQATDGVNTSFTVSNASITASSVVTVSYRNSVNEVISHAISAIATGSFTVQFAAIPAAGGAILFTVVN